MSKDTDNISAVKIISPTFHGILDYVVVAIFLMAPSVFGLSGAFAYGAYGLATIHFLLTVTTRFAAGLFSVLPVRAHALIELIVAIGMVVSPWVFQFADQAAPRNFFLLFGIVLFVLGFLTQYQSKSKEDRTNTSRKGQPEDSAYNKASVSNSSESKPMQSNDEQS